MIPAADREALRSAGMRFTSQRALIMSIIHRGHHDADEIYRRARRKDPRLSLSTVYRTLQVLKRLGLVTELHLDEAHHHYEFLSDARHHHLVCLGCGKVIEFQYPLASRVKNKVPAARGFIITETDVRMSGYCPQCQQEKERGSPAPGRREELAPSTSGDKKHR